uniref:Uncharacterized protein n=1 Tax=Cannabis sativa TaxID=3483 RepID=A0A803QPK3_CANSA
MTPYSCMEVNHGLVQREFSWSGRWASLEAKLEAHLGRELEEDVNLKIGIIVIGKHPLGVFFLILPKMFEDRRVLFPDSVEEQ